MTSALVLDTGPLGLVCQRPGLPAAEACRERVATKVDGGIRLVVPEVADHELRRELIRIDATAAVRRLDRFLDGLPGRYLPITTAAMRRASTLWADVRRRGLPTADPKELDGDANLAAQVLTSDLPLGETVVATTNIIHLTRFLPAQLWSTL